KSSAIARSMVTKYGMSDRIGPISFDDSSRSIFIGRDFSQTKGYSEKVAAVIDDEVKRIFDDASELCEEILSEHSDLVAATAEYLLEHETIDGEDFKAFCQNGGVMPTKEGNKSKPGRRIDADFPEVPDLSEFFRKKE
ncbi:MAG: hypothetical protein FWF05_09760, partial [Oscillospiraceae bacterium]|nr:hypothetical protein [Oscillospiraceae bacterium]